MEFLNEYHLAGLFIGICTFLIIGLFHPVVVKAEYYWGTKCWWIFLILGIAGVIASLIVQKEENANTPNKEDKITLSILKEAITPAMPSIRNIHQHFVPQ